jgi:N-acetylmuramoyl-L-alanine amidase
LIFKCKLHSIFLAVLFFISDQPLVAEELIAVRDSFEGNKFRVVFDLSGHTELNVFSLQNPDRIVVDLFDVTLTDMTLARLISPLSKNSIVSSIRSSTRNTSDLRVVFNTNQLVDWTTFEIVKSNSQPHRVVLDLFGSLNAASEARDIIIAIDPGHGGRDPGSSGAGGTLEKNVVLSVAKKLRQVLLEYEGVQVIMTRDSDELIDLRERIKIARDANADILVSLHTDAFSDPRVGGATVYTLSNRGANNEASRLLANRENGGVSLGNATLSELPFPDIADDLITFYQAISIESGRSLGAHIIDQLGFYTRVRKQEVQDAGFVVLKAPDVASVLVEMAYITNVREERMLASEKGQEDLARGISNGILSYLIDNAPPDSYIAWNPPVLPIEPRRHTIAWGETLSGIALRYQVSLTRIRQANNIQGDRIREGQILIIPLS